MKYKLPEGIEYYQFADIDPEIVKLCEFRTNRLWDFDIPEDTFNKCIIYQDQFFGNKHVCCINNSAGTIKFYQHMMYLQRVVNDPNDEEFVELEIIPAEIYLRENGDFNLFTVPLARNVLFLIGNQPYFCEELKYNMESKGCPEVVEGTFFRLE